jgi:hypothetical protein
MRFTARYEEAAANLLSPKSIFGFPLPSSRNRKKLTGFVAPTIILSHSFRLVAEAHFIPKGQHAGLALAYD